MGEGFRSGCEDRSHCAKFHPSAAFTALAVGLWFRRLGPFSFLPPPSPAARCRLRWPRLVKGARVHGSPCPVPALLESEKPNVTSKPHQGKLQQEDRQMSKKFEVMLMVIQGKEYSLLHSRGGHRKGGRVLVFFQCFCRVPKSLGALGLGR